MKRIIALASLVILHACGSAPNGMSATSTTATDSAATPRVFVDARGVPVQVVSTQRIIPLDGDVAEIVFALGLGEQVVATDISATYPPEAEARPKIGYQRALNAETILGFEPTLVIGTDIAGPPGAIEELERVGVPVAIVPSPADATGPATKIVAIAELLGVPELGRQLAAEVEREIAAVELLVPDRPEARRLRVAMLYLRGERVQLVFGKETSIDWLIEAAGAVNVAAEMGVTGSAEITAEALTKAVPDVLLVTTDGLASVGGVDGLLAMPSVAGTPAAKNRAVLAYDAQLMLGNGPRTGVFLAQFVSDLETLTERLAAKESEPEKESP